MIIKPTLWWNRKSWTSDSRHFTATHCTTITILVVFGLRSNQLSYALKSKTYHDVLCLYTTQHTQFSCSHGIEGTLEINVDEFNSDNSYFLRVITQQKKAFLLWQSEISIVLTGFVRVNYLHELIFSGLCKQRKNTWCFFSFKLHSKENLEVKHDQMGNFLERFHQGRFKERKFKSYWISNIPKKENIYFKLKRFVLIKILLYIYIILPYLNRKGRKKCGIFKKKILALLEHLR